MPRKIIDLRGKVFGNREVIDMAAPTKDTNGCTKTMWLTRCVDCGMEKVMTAGNIKSGHSCSCKRNVNTKKASVPARRCPYNSGVDCAGGDCDRCGWKRSAK